MRSPCCSGTTRNRLVELVSCDNLEHEKLLPTSVVCTPPPPRHVTPPALTPANRASAPVACLTHAVQGCAPRAAQQRPDSPPLPAAALLSSIVSANPPATSRSLESENNSVAPRPQVIGEPYQQELKGTELVDTQTRAQRLCRSHAKLQPRAPSLRRMYPILG
jgi:hypothetical protein